MLYYLNEWMELFSPLRVFRYITFRAMGGAFTAFVLTLLIGPSIIRMLTALKIKQQVRVTDSADLYALHGKKKNTPTMGGVMIVLAVLVSSLLWAIPSNGYVLLTLATMLVLGGTGFMDDYLKVSRKNSRGLPGRYKLLIQITWAVVVGIILFAWPASRDYAGQLMVPFFKEPVITSMSLGGALLFFALVIAGASNAVNLTDGLDGLAIGCSNSAAVAYLAIAYVAGNSVAASYLQVPFIPGTGELTVVCACLFGAGLGFLWFNCHPAKVFMGDTGSLAIGGTIAMVAICTKQELLLIFVGGVFVLEAASVILQVVSFKMKKRRIFRCAPLHHHYEFLEKDRAKLENRDLEVVETMITTRFWILSILFAALGLATLKLR
ncbi:MAG: phospho-N-acetylmuramoyl-pentapeptide-transferase [Verrucomicrobia bacterium]|nr:phospho-N-acetylmuramoyl-pentapeptide-transferase [Kiritimatiellia bacterium]MCB1101464.1 phospho-N-acetylmuramoyl-pentapeptide-transferase [Kiritimatiellia bacterium]MCP5487143.1 phospho-N-acetylmuramoyl-pentapeptide-transferase [Verrucomicrobiota bacterium]